MAKKTILIIDDAPEVGKILRLHLEKKYEVKEAHDGEEGLQMISHLRPDLIIMDINMPKMSGLELYQALCSRSGLTEFPVIILTVREELGPLFKDLDVDGFITKPFEIEQVLQEIDLVIERRSSDYGLKADFHLSKGPKKVMVVEDDEQVLGKIALVFLTKGYIVNCARSGQETFQNIINFFPDLVLIKLGLPDIPGDTVVSKLKRMPRTMNIPFVVYTQISGHLDIIAVKKSCEMMRTNLVESSEPEVLLKRVEDFFQGK